MYAIQWRDLLNAIHHVENCNDEYKNLQKKLFQPFVCFLLFSFLLCSPFFLFSQQSNHEVTKNVHEKKKKEKKKEIPNCKRGIGIEREMSASQCRCLYNGRVSESVPI